MFQKKFRPKKSCSSFPGIVSLSLLVELEKYPLLPVSSTPSAPLGPRLAPAAAPVVGPKCRSSVQELSERGTSWQWTMPWALEFWNLIFFEKRPETIHFEPKIGRFHDVIGSISRILGSLSQPWSEMFGRRSEPSME